MPYGRDLMDRYDDEVQLDAPPDMMYGMKYPFTRRDGIAEGCLVFVLAFPVFLASLSALPIDMSTFVMVVASSGLSLGTGFLVARQVARRAERRRRISGVRQTELRVAFLEAETRHKLEEARAAGAFDRWEKR